MSLSIFRFPSDGGGSGINRPRPVSGARIAGTIDTGSNVMPKPVPTPIIAGPIDTGVGVGAVGDDTGLLAPGGGIFTSGPVSSGAIDSATAGAGGSAVATAKRHPIASALVVLAIILLFI